MLINLVLNTPFDKSFHVLSRLQLQFLLFPCLSLFLLEFLLGLPLQIDFLHDSIDGLIFFDIWLQFVGWYKWQSLPNMVKFC